MIYVSFTFFDILRMASWLPRRQSKDCSTYFTYVTVPKKIGGSDIFQIWMLHFTSKIPCSNSYGSESLMTCTWSRDVYSNSIRTSHHWSTCTPDSVELMQHSLSCRPLLLQVLCCNPCCNAPLLWHSRSLPWPAATVTQQLVTWYHMIWSCSIWLYLLIILLWLNLHILN